MRSVSPTALSPRTRNHALAAVVLAGVAVFGAGPAAAQDAIAYCLDEARNVITTVVAGQCEGRVVSKQEAERFRAAERAARLRRALQGPGDTVIPDKQRVGHGTGFFIGKNGTVVTNRHVIAQCTAVSVATTDGREAPARILAADPRHDLAALGTTLIPSSVAVFRDPVPADAGRPLFVIGYPTRTLAPIKPQLAPATTVGEGDPLIDALRVPSWFMKMKGFVYPGNSGGPVLDDQGHANGVVVAQVHHVKVFQHTGQLLRELGFAIDNRTVFGFLDRHRITYQTRAEGPTLTETEVFAAGKPFVVRINCWR